MGGGQREWGKEKVEGWGEDEEFVKKFVKRRCEASRVYYASFYINKP